MAQLFAVPAFYPTFTDANFTTLLNTLPGGSIVVLELFEQDSASRPMPSSSFFDDIRTQATNFQNRSAAQGGRVIVLGYVDTDFGKSAACINAAMPATPPRSLRLASDIKNYIDYWYMVIPSLDGIFFDDGPAPYIFTGDSTISASWPIAQCVKDFYSDLYAYVANKGAPSTRGAIAGNAGGAVLLNASQYQESTGDWIMHAPNRACDIAILWETTACQYLQEDPGALPTNLWPSTPPAWWNNPAYNPSRIAHTLYGCRDKTEMGQVVAYSQSRGAGYVFVTDAASAEYDGLPSAFMWTDEIAAAATPPARSLPSPNSYHIYVRDWTISPTSHDDGSEPSTGPDFYSTSDVWNSIFRNAPPNPFNANDQPNSDAVLPPSFGSNYAFVRVSRLATDAEVPVMATFLWANFGLGNNFRYANADPTDLMRHPVPLTLPRSTLSMFLSAGSEWKIPAVQSSHLCLAVEVTAPCDTFRQTLFGRAPGPASTDPDVVGDNNIAQRNLGILNVLTPMQRISTHAILHNPHLKPYSFHLQYSFPEREAWSEVHLRIINPRHEQTYCPAEMPCRGTIATPIVEPGENCLLELSWAIKRLDHNALVAQVYEIVNGKPISGFAITARRSSLANFVSRNLCDHAEVCSRITALFADADAERGSSLARETLERADAGSYLTFIKAQMHLLQDITATVEREITRDPLQMQGGLAELRHSIRAGDLDTIAVAHMNLLSKLDASLTICQLSHGDIADVVQMVRWQAELYEDVYASYHLAFARHLERIAKDFVGNHGVRGYQSTHYSSLIRQSLPGFHRTAELLHADGLKSQILLMEQELDEVVVLEKRHHDYLLNLSHIMQQRRATS